MILQGRSTNLAVSREGTTTLPGNVPVDVRAERGKEPSSVVKDKRRETIMQVEIQDVIDIDREAEINCTDEDSELGVNETEVRSEEDRNLKNIEELREQQTEVFEPLRTLQRSSLREKRMPHRYQDYQMNTIVSEPYDTKLKNI